MVSGTAIDWFSKKQPVVALSCTEAEYVALSAASCMAKQTTNRHQSTTTDINAHQGRQPKNYCCSKKFSFS